MKRGILNFEKAAAYTEINAIIKVKGKNNLYRKSLGVIMLQMRYERRSMFIKRTLRLLYVKAKKTIFANRSTTKGIFSSLSDKCDM